MTKYALAILGIIFALLFWYLASWPDPSSGQYPIPFGIEALRQIYNKIYRHRFYMGMILALLQACILYYPVVADRYKQKKIIENLLEAGLIQIFRGNIGYRATVYRKASGIYVFVVVWLWRCLLKFRKEHVERNCWKNYFRNPPRPCIRKKYLVAYTRRGIEGDESTTTYFRIPDPYSHEFDGYVAYVWNLGTISSVDLPDITDIELKVYSTLEDIRSRIKRKRVMDYMKEGKMLSSGSFQKLKTMHRISTSLWATPIKLDPGFPLASFWGVLVFDSEVESDSFTIDDRHQRLVDLSNLIQRILSK